jgi:hypothetical protein
MVLCRAGKITCGCRYRDVLPGVQWRGYGYSLGHTLRTTIVVALAGLAVAAWLFKYWSDTNSKDMGTMSRQWLAEYNASHP